MKLPSIGIIGNGFVGGATAEGFKHYVPSCKVYDVNPLRTVDDYFEVIEQDVLFVCLPTPMKADGRVDTSIIHSALRTLESATLETHKCVIIKSTLPPIDLVEMSLLYAPTLHIIYSPEFLTERTAILDFQQTSRLIFGDYRSDEPVALDVVDAKTYNVAMIDHLFTGRFPAVPQIWTSIEEASLIKYCTNVFFAAKVSLFNEFAMVAAKYGVDFQQLIGHVLLDQRIGRSHFQVPGHDGKFGFGGHCFPKDLNGFMHIAEDVDIQPLMAQAAWVTNTKVRPERDWEADKGRAVSTDFEEKK
jgi:UDPglucose 6-dehydrogenase